jgi:hypothetical protein
MFLKGEAMTSRDELDTPLKAALQRLIKATPHSHEMQFYVDEVRRVSQWALNAILAAEKIEDQP